MSDLLEKIRQLYIVTLTNLCVLLTIFEHKKCSGQDEGLAHKV